MPDWELRQWLIGGAVFAVIIGGIFGMIKFNVSDAISMCENAGYAAPDGGFSVTKCPANEDYAFDSVAIVAGNVANSPVPELSDEASKYMRNSLANTDGDLPIFVYSATPSGERINVDNKKVKRAGNVSSFIRNSTKKLDAINTAIKQTPVEAGADYFNTVVTAAQAVRTSPSNRAPLVLVIGSGLSDSQPLNFANSDLLHADPLDILNVLKTTDTVNAGQLTGVKIVWSGLGITAAPQQPLDAKEKANLRKIYEKIFNYMGATFVTDDTVMAGDSVNSNYHVQSVKVDGVQGGVIVYHISANSIGFAPDSAKITDLDKAESALQSVVTGFRQCTNAKISVEGYEARLAGEAVKSTSQLTEDRANAVKQLLVGQGVPDNQISAAGKGNSDFDGRISELNSEGKWDSDRAQKNRVVLVSIDGGGTCSS